MSNGEDLLANVFHKDENRIIADANIPWEALENTTVLITGVTGLIGSALTRVLYAVNRRYNLGLRIIGLSRNESKRKSFRYYENFKLYIQDIREDIRINENVDYIFHTAAITKSADMVEKPVDVIETSFLGTRNILEFAKQKSVKGVVYVSSMEIYGITDLSEVTEADLGYIDLMKARSSYPESKRMCENLCTSYYEQYGLPVKSARMAQTFGAGTPVDDTRVFAQFARSVLKGTDIVLHTAGESRGNYCYLADAIRALFVLLLKGKDGTAYNIANPQASMTIREMAEMVVDEFGDGKIKVVIDIPGNSDALGYAPTVGYRLNIEKMLALGWKPEYELKDMYKRMIKDWQEEANA